MLNNNDEKCEKETTPHERVMHADNANNNDNQLIQP